MERSLVILCVDDEEYILRAMQRLFLDTGYILLTAANADDALQQIEKENGVDCVISDYRMPGMNGVELLQEIQRTWPETIRIILTGYADTETTLKAINDGKVDRLLTKPWDDEELLVVIAEELARYDKRVCDKLRADQAASDVLQLERKTGDLQKKLDAQLRTIRVSEARLREAQKIARIGDWVWLTAHDELSWSDQMYTLHGLSRELFQPSMEAYAAFLPEEERSVFVFSVRQALSNKVPFSFSHSIVRTDGSLRHLRVEGKAWLDQNDEVLGLLGTTQDVTEQWAAKQEIQRLNRELEQQVVVRTAELKAANSELEELCSAISHDLRAPLRRISGFGEALMEDLPPDISPENHMYLERITSECQRATEQIDGLLELFRATRGELNREEVDISAISEAILKGFCRSSPERSVTWHVEPGLSANCDRVLVHNVLENLLGNAWKYTGKVPGVASITVSREVSEGPAVFCVADNGIGFDQAYADKLFLPFQRLHGAEFAGTGMGLATVNRIIIRHGGKIRGEGQPGAGSRFYFSLEP